MSPELARYSVPGIGRNYKKEHLQVVDGVGVGSVSSDLRQKFYYDFREIFEPGRSDNIHSYISKIERMFGAKAKRWNAETAVQWQLRNYLSIKMIAHASILLSSAQFATEKNLLIAVPYLKYYALLSSARCLIYSTPDLEWKGTLTVEMTHQNIINTASNILGRFAKGLRADASDTMNAAKTEREMFSYSFPLTGRYMANRASVALDSAIALCTLMVELAQLNSEILQRAVTKLAPSQPTVVPSPADIEMVSGYGDGRHFDDDDYYRFMKHFEKFGTPVPLDWMATEGFVDDVFGGWHPEDDSGDVFNPDDDHRVIFDFQ